VDHKDGKYNNIARSRTIAHALQTIADQLYAMYFDTPLWITVLHGALSSKAEALVQGLSARLNVARMETLRISRCWGAYRPGDCRCSSGTDAAI